MSSSSRSQAAIGDARSGAAYAGLEFSRLGRRVRGRIRVGYKKFDVRAADGPDYQGLVGDSQLSDPAGQAVRHPGLIYQGRPVLALV